MKGQLLDVTVIIASVEKAGNDCPYATTQIYRLDLEGEHLESFLKALELEPGVVHMDKLGAVES